MPLPQAIMATYLAFPILAWPVSRFIFNRNKKPFPVWLGNYVAITLERLFIFIILTLGGFWTYA